MKKKFHELIILCKRGFEPRSGQLVRSAFQRIHVQLHLMNTVHVEAFNRGCVEEKNESGTCMLAQNFYNAVSGGS